MIDLVTLAALIFAGGYALDKAMGLYTGVKGVGVESKHMELLQKQLAQQPMLAKMIEAGKEKTIQQLLGIRKGERQAEQQTELMRSIGEGRTRQTALMLAVLQSMMGNAPQPLETRGFPPSSIVSLIR
jgi:hypothetical protein